MSKTARLHWFNRMYNAAPAIKMPHIPCRFGCTEAAVGLFFLSHGCICYKDEVQALCVQHALRSTPYGSFQMIARWE